MPIDTYESLDLSAEILAIIREIRRSVDQAIASYDAVLSMNNPITAN